MAALISAAACFKIARCGCGAGVTPASTGNEILGPVAARRSDLAEARKAAGYTQEDLAEKLHVDRSTVHRWETKGVRPQPYLWPRLANLLGMSRDELREALTSVDPQGRVRVNEVSRRSVLQSGLGLSVLAPLREGLAEHSIGADGVEDLISIRGSLVSADSLLGPGDLASSAVAQVKEIARLWGVADPSVRGQLFEIGALFAEFCGWLADDLGKFDEGAAWSGRALEWAHSSANFDVVAYILMRMSQQAQLVGQRVRASALAYAAMQYKTQLRSSRVRAALHQQAAHAAALDGNGRDALVHLDSALDLSGCEGSTVDPYSLANYCTPTYVAVQRAAVLGILGRFGDALAEYDQVLNDWPRSFRREFGLHMARRTVVAARAGIVDTAIESGTTALQIARDTHSRRTVRELGMGISHLNSHGAVPGLRAFLDEVATEGDAEWAR